MSAAQTGTRQQFYVATDSEGLRFPYSPGAEEPINLLEQEVVHSTAAGQHIDCDVEAHRAFMRLATSPTACPFHWPARLFQVEPIGRLWHYEGTCWHSDGLRVVTELPAHDLYGPQGLQALQVIERAQRLTLEEAATLRDSTSRDDTDTRWAHHTAKILCSRAAGVAGRLGAYVAGWVEPRILLWENASMGAPLEEVHKFLPRSPHRTHLKLFDDPLMLRATIGALVCRDLIGDTFTREHYRTLTQAWADVIGPLHPDDATPAH